MIINEYIKERGDIVVQIHFIELKEFIFIAISLKFDTQAPIGNRSV